MRGCPCSNTTRPTAGPAGGDGAQDVGPGQRIADDVPDACAGDAAAEVRDVVRAGTPTHGRLRDRLVAVALATVGFDLVCAVLAFLFEQHQQQTQIKSLGSALFWTTTQMLTVSSSLQNPISFPARVLDVVMEIYAITVIASLAGALGAFLMKRGEEIDAAAGHA